MKLAVANHVGFPLEIPIKTRHSLGLPPVVPTVDGCSSTPVKINNTLRSVCPCVPLGDIISVPFTDVDSQLS